MKMLISCSVLMNYIYLSPRCALFFPEPTNEMWVDRCNKSYFFTFLADRTNGRAYATAFFSQFVRRLSSSSVRNVLWLCVLQQKLLLTAYKKIVYEKSIGTKMNDLDLCLEVVKGHVMSTTASHSPLNSRKLLRLGSKRPPIGNGLWESN